MKIVPALTAALLLFSPFCKALDAKEEKKLTTLLECKGKYGDLLDFATAVDQLPGIKELESKNPFLKLYQLDKPIRANQYQSDRLILAGNGISLMLPGETKENVAAKLKLAKFELTPSKVFFIKEVKKVGKLTASDVTTHPDTTLLGCEYNSPF